LKKMVHNLDTFNICVYNSNTTDTTCILPEDNEEDKKWIVPDHILQRKYGITRVLLG